MDAGDLYPRRPSPAALPSCDPSSSSGGPPSCKKDRSYMTILLANNIHCASCVAYATEVLSFLPCIWSVDISIITHEIRVRHAPETSSVSLLRALVDAAFEVYHVTAFDELGVKISDIEKSPWTRSGMLSSSSRLSHSIGDAAMKSAPSSSRRRMHIENCDACKEEQDSQKPDSQHRGPKGAKKKWFNNGRKSLYPTISQDSHPELLQKQETSSPMSTPTTTGSMESEMAFALAKIPRQPEAAARSKETIARDEYDARISIVGMTCASCVNTVSNEVQQLDCVKSITVNLLTNSANLTYLGPRENINVIINQIEDIGFEASIDDVTSTSQQSDLATRSSRYAANISISGMTCGACVGSVTRGVEELPFITSVVIDLLGNNGRVEFEGEEHLDEIVEQIEDLGFEATVIDCSPLFGEAGAPTARTVMVQVDGMFCHHCPERIIASLGEIPVQPLIIEENPTLKNPIVKIIYTPRPPEFTVRTIISKIESINDAFSARVYHPPSIEDRSREMQLRERRRLLLRLLFTFIAVIPTFLIGIVWMSLVPSTDKIRIYLEQPMWVGTVTRMEWALFILTTPVMVYGTDVFHRRAIKEIRALWRPGSKVPILRRFYRFGSMNLLISAGTSVAYFSSLAVLIIGALTDKSKASHTPTYFDSVVFLTFFILIGRSIEAYSKAKTGDGVSMLGKLRPSEALLVIDSSTSITTEEAVDEKNHVPSAGRIERVHVDLLEPGDTVSVPHGASPPADGYVTAGSEWYQFDESSLTGESKPAKKFAGYKVYAGSVNVGKPLHVKVSEVGSTSMLEQIVAVVREGQTKRAPVERVADTVTGYFVPAITFIAITTFLVWFALGQSGALPSHYLDMSQGGWAFWSLEFAIAVFVVACPCGLALAAPTALFVGGGLAAKHGILVRGGGEAFQEASRLDAIVFDKTGTLTEGGSLKVSDHEILLVDPELRQAAWVLARALEESSNHPIAQAVVGFCDSMPSSASIISSSNITEISGQGMKGTFTVSMGCGSTDDKKSNHMVFEAAIGNERLLRSIGSTDPESYYLSNLLSTYQSAGKSTAILSIRKLPDIASTADSPPPPFSPTIVFGTSDPIRSETVSVIAELQSRNVEVYMCTGDNARTAQAVASSVGISASNIMANVLPNQKADYIRQIQQQPPNNPSKTNLKKKKRIIAFAGDGTNDSPALAASDVSIAMASGSDVAVSSASFILLTSDLSKIPELVKLSRRVFWRVKMNFVWAAVYNVLLVPVAAGVFYPIVTGRAGVAGGDAGHEHGGVETHWRLGPVWASAAMALSSISVVCSSLALRFEWGSFIARIKSMGRRK